ncbi:GNAT family N-acetyltransferase [Roseisalinus antarcticus]|uniref:N-acetyltransferase domain-containing protein n=1 Tax=Roseisalinus antarcticus TaxID=254357 RepID=A0A1Y5SE27_9RHOB|nr:GNAT family N-acetyltransferase [Roseisalinus antarcticus]SLN37061.1 hypothetical protein ROA7023_01371 [Roseisalinus antarcticus]
MTRLPPETPRLRLVLPGAAHKAAHDGFCASPRSNVAMAEQATDHFDALLNHHELLGYGPFVAVRKAGGEAIGVFGPWNIDSQPDPEIAFMIWDPVHEGRGYGFEATVAARAFAHWVLGWRSAVSYISAANRRASRLAGRLGALRDGAWTTPAGTVLDVWRHPDPEGA